LAGRSLEAIDALKEAIRLDPKLSEAYQELATLYGDQGRHEEAIRLMIQATQLQANDLALLFTLGQLHLRAGSFQAAIQVFQRIIGMKSDFGNNILD